MDGFYECRRRSGRTESEAQEAKLSSQGIVFYFRAWTGTVWGLLGKGFGCIRRQKAGRERSRIKVKISWALQGDGLILLCHCRIGTWSYEWRSAWRPELSTTNEDDAMISVCLQPNSVALYPCLSFARAGSADGSSGLGICGKKGCRRGDRRACRFDFLHLQWLLHTKILSDSSRVYGPELSR